LPDDGVNIYEVEGYPGSYLLELLTQSDDRLWLFMHEDTGVEGLDLVKLSLDVMQRPRKIPMSRASWEEEAPTSAREPLIKSLVKRPVHPLSVVDKSDFCPSCLTALMTRLMLASQGALPTPHFTQRGFVWPIMCTCSCLWSVSSSRWRGLAPREERPSAARSSVCSSPAHQTIASPVVSPRQAWNLLLRQYAPGVRSKAGGVFPNA
jgi:hypothetical protein